MRKYISSYIDNGKTDKSKSIRFFAVFLFSLLFSSAFISFLYIIYNKIESFIQHNLELYFSFFFNVFSYLSDVFLSLASNYLFGAFVLLSMIFAIFSINHVEQNKKSLGKHKNKLLLLFFILFVYSLINNISHSPVGGLYYFLSYVLSLFFMFFSLIIFIVPFSTNLKEIFNILRANEDIFPILFVIALIYFVLFIIFSYNGFSNHIVPLMPLFLLCIMVFIRFIDTSCQNEIMKIKFELKGFDISAIENQYQCELNKSMFFMGINNVFTQLEIYQDINRLDSLIERDIFEKYIEKNKAKDDIFIYIKGASINDFTIVDLDGNKIITVLTKSLKKS